jgi:hypothetical protein
MGGSVRCALTAAESHFERGWAARYAVQCKFQGAILIADGRPGTLSDARGSRQTRARCLECLDAWKLVSVATVAGKE